MKGWRCGDCRFWELADVVDTGDEGIGRVAACRRYPPVVNPDWPEDFAQDGNYPGSASSDFRAWAFPVVREKDCCGEFQWRDSGGARPRARVVPMSSDHDETGTPVAPETPDFSETFSETPE